jgi:hypothetical protein
MAALLNAHLRIFPRHRICTIGTILSTAGLFVKNYIQSTGIRNEKFNFALKIFSFSESEKQLMADSKSCCPLFHAPLLNILLFV